MGRYYDDYLLHSVEITIDDGETEYVFNRYWDDCLYHSGIKGMHWGNRRYQYEDGSYTEAGMVRRYGHGHINGARHTGKATSSARRAASLGSDSQKKKGWSTAAKVAAGVAGAAAVGAVGYAAYKNRDKISEAAKDQLIKRELKGNKYDAGTEAALRDEYNQRKSDYDALKARYEATMDKSIKNDLQRRMSGDAELRNVVASAEKLMNDSGRRFTSYQASNPDAIRENMQDRSLKELANREVNKTKTNIKNALKSGEVKAAEEKKRVYTANRVSKEDDARRAEVDKALNREHKTNIVTQKGDQKLMSKTKWSPEQEEYYQKKYKLAENAQNKATSEWNKSRKTTVSGGTRITDRGDNELKAKEQHAQQVAKNAGTQYLRYQNQDPTVQYKNREAAREFVTNKVKQGMANTATNAIKFVDNSGDELAVLTMDLLKKNGRTLSSLRS